LPDTRRQTVRHLNQQEWWSTTTPFSRGCDRGWRHRLHRGTQGRTRRARHRLVVRNGRHRPPQSSRQSYLSHRRV